MATKSAIRETLQLTPLGEAVVEALEQQVIEENEPQDILKKYIQTNEDLKALEARLEVLKPIVDAYRKGEKKVSFPGSFRNVKGNFNISNVPGSKDTANVKIVQTWLSMGIITQEQYDACVKTSEYAYNLVTFKKA